LPSNIQSFKMHLAIINGPNLNLLGIREPQIYGTMSFDDYSKQLELKFTNIKLSYFQSNIEGELIDYVQNCLAQKIDGILLNAGAYTHTSIALADAIAAVAIPTIEIHISNVMAREDFRKTSYIASKCIGTISGLGLMSYELAIQYFSANNNKQH
jgi:3-dehydroquinate dehydratase II